MPKRLLDAEALRAGGEGGRAADGAAGGAADGATLLDCFDGVAVVAAGVGLAVNFWRSSNMLLTESSTPAMCGASASCRLAAIELSDSYDDAVLSGCEASIEDGSAGAGTIALPGSS